MSFSPNGRMLAANDRNGVVHLWRLHGGPRTMTVSGPGSVSPPGGPNVNAVAFSPRGTILAMGGNDGQAYLFDTATDSTSRTLSAPDTSGVTSVAFSSDGALLAASKMDGMTYVWNLDTRSRISLDDPDGAVIESVAFSPNSEWLATGDANGHTYLWNLAAKKTQIKPAKSLTNPTSAAAPRPGTRSFPWRSARTTTRSPPPTRTATSTSGRCTDPGGPGYGRAWYCWHLGPRQYPRPGVIAGWSGAGNWPAARPDDLGQAEPGRAEPSRASVGAARQVLGMSSPHRSAGTGYGA